MPESKSILTSSALKRILIAHSHSSCGHCESAFWSGGGFGGNAQEKAVDNQCSSVADFRVIMSKASPAIKSFYQLPGGGTRLQRENNRCQAIFCPPLDKK
jgi:hypothetical protein